MPSHYKDKPTSTPTPATGKGPCRPGDPGCPDTSRGPKRTSFGINQGDQNADIRRRHRKLRRQPMTPAGRKRRDEHKKIEEAFTP